MHLILRLPPFHKLASKGVDWKIPIKFEFFWKGKGENGKRDELNLFILCFFKKCYKIDSKRKKGIKIRFLFYRTPFSRKILYQNQRELISFVEVMKKCTTLFQYLRFQEKLQFDISVKVSFSRKNVYCPIFPHKVWNGIRTKNLR